MDEMFKGVAESNRAEAEADLAGTNAADAARTYEKKRTLDALFAKHTKPDGRFDGAAFIADAASAGLGRAEIEQAADYDAKRKTIASQNALQESMQRGAGYNPDVVDRPGVPTQQAAASQPGTGAPLGPSSIDPDKLRSPSEVGGTPQTGATVRQGGLTAQDVVDHINGKTAGDTQTVEVFGRVPSESKGEEARLPPPAEADPFTPEPPPRTWWQEFSDSYNPQAMGGGIGSSADAMQQDAGLLQWAPKDDSNQFRKFSSALQAKLNAGGFKDANDYLGKVYQSVFDANMPSQPNQALLFLGAEGMAKFRQQEADFKAGIQKARGLAQQKVLEAREKLESAAKEYGSSTVEDRKSYVGQGYILRDASKRDVANALLVNRDNINHAVKSVDSAGLDKTKLTLALPQLVRAYATSLNPGQQLSEGSLAEVTAMALPELADKKDMIRNLAVGIFNAMRGKTDVLQDIANGADAQTAAALRSAMTRIAGELPGLNEKALGNYVIPPKGAKPFKYARVGEAGASLPRVTSQAQYDALKVGAEYVGPDGVKHKKGGN